jgi:hypothetical protein
LQVGDGEGVVGVAGLGAVDLEAVAERKGGGWFDLARHGDEVQRRLRGECESIEERQGGEGPKVHGVTVQQRDGVPIGLTVSHGVQTVLANA